MSVRTTRQTVTFASPFALSGIEGLQPAGTYTIETDEELLADMSFPAYRRIATLLFLPGRPGSAVTGQIVSVDPSELLRLAGQQ